MNYSKYKEEELKLLRYLTTLWEDGVLPEKSFHILKDLFVNYLEAISHESLEPIFPLFHTLFSLVGKECQNPYSFSPYHEKLIHPFDYYQFGLDFIEPLLDRKHSKILGVDRLKQIQEAVKNKENVILLANHQTEVDPQIIDLLLHDSFPQIGKEMIYVAGDRVITDPLAIPFSLGRNLICIYSKKYIDHPPELKEKKQLHNQKTMRLLGKMLSEGENVIYVAPSGGRDRKGITDRVEVAPFHPQSVEMFYLISKKAKRPTHFYPLSLSTYNLLPPPSTIIQEIGEPRRVSFSPCHLFFGEEIKMDQLSQKKDREELRTERANEIWKIVKNNHDVLVKNYLVE